MQPNKQHPQEEDDSKTSSQLHCKALLSDTVIKTTLNLGSCTNFFPGLHGQPISVKYPRLAAKDHVIRNGLTATE